MVPDKEVTICAIDPAAVRPISQGGHEPEGPRPAAGQAAVGAVGVVLEAAAAGRVSMPTSGCQQSTLLHIVQAGYMVAGWSLSIG